MSDDSGPDWHDWSPKFLRQYIRGIREQSLEAYGGYCQWIGCEQSRLKHDHFCAEHAIVAKANE